MSRSNNTPPSTRPATTDTTIDDPIDAGAELPNDASGERDDRTPASEYLLDRLLYKGILPRYAFPTDVATFFVFDIDKSTPYKTAFRYTPSQGLTLALSQYAPGKEVWIAGKLFVSGAIYSPVSSDRYNAWQQRRLYYECGVCHYARTQLLTEGSKGERLDCPACGRPASLGEARYWLRPPGFVHPVSKPERTSSDDPAERSYATRAKLMAPSPSDPGKWIGVTTQLRHYHLKNHLLVTNRGPRDEGYHYCTKCGVIEPSAAPNHTVFSPHPKPYPSGKDPNCPGDATSTGIVLGTDFITDVLLVSLTVAPPYRLSPGILATEVALRTASEAIAKAACELLELEVQELQAEFRPALTDNGQRGIEAEIYLYDTLPGGAGFAKQAGRLGKSLFERAVRILEHCPDTCDRSCYRCLRSYKNKFEHDLLDRHIGAALLRHVLNGEAMTLPPSRVQQSLDKLYYDLVRSNDPTITVQRAVSHAVPGVGTVTAPILVMGNGQELIIDLNRPLCTDVPTEHELEEVRDFSAVPLVTVDELLVRRNLPRASAKILSAFGLADA
ncbi:MAG: DUF1998 domain-containing protein [Candidatus Solibacter sp.]|jgi:hypothetical protein